ncbi:MULTISPECIES: DedA family protein [Priestia]|uniref:DedA family protein n=1 Tax=Priestia TaxID=2800373 RepID=UPI003D2F1237
MSGKAENWVKKYGDLAIIANYFLPGMRHLMGYFCGILHLPLKTYTLYTGTSDFL